MASQGAPMAVREKDVPDYKIGRDEQLGDCITCRLVGSGAFIGLGTYSYASGYMSLRQNRDAILKSRSMFGMRSRHAALAGTSAALVGVGLYRWFN